jgi:hypothetical protein
MFHLRSESMMRLWLQFTLVVALALLAWICGLDTTGASLQSASLWGAVALAGVPVVYRLLRMR